MENTVGNIATAVIATLRGQTFTSLPHLRVAIRDRLADYNGAPFQKRAGSRASVFTAEEAPLLRPLPVVAFEISAWARGRRVGRDGHVVWARNRYSVPYVHIGSPVDLRVTEATLEVWRHDERLASHPLLPATAVNQYRTRETDLPHGRPWREWDPERARAWADRIGPDTTTVVDRIFASVAVDEQGLDAALAVLRLSRRYSPARLESSCTIALTAGIRSPRYAHLAPILATGQDKTRPDHTPPPAESADAGFVRGADYYAGGSR